MSLYSSVKIRIYTNISGEIWPRSGCRTAGTVAEKKRTFNIRVWILTVGSKFLTDHRLTKTALNGNKAMFKCRH